LTAPASSRFITEVDRQSAFSWTLAGLVLVAACGGRSRRVIEDGDAGAGPGSGFGGGAATGGTTGGASAGGGAGGRGGTATGGGRSTGGDGNATGGGSGAGSGGLGTGGTDAGRSATGGSDAGRASTGGAGNGGDAGDGTGGAPEPPDTLVQILADGPWDVEQQTTGIAVDSSGTIYVSDSEHVFRVEGTSVFVHLDLADLASAGLDGTLRFQDLDIDAYDRLYVAAGGMLFSSVGAHELELWSVFDGDATLQSRAHVGVVGFARVLVVDDEGLKEVTDDGLVSRYGVKALERTADCATEDLATTGSGVFLYHAGCDESPLLRGYAAGTGVDVLYRAGLADSKPISASNFVCSARDPAGGFYVVTRQATGFAPILYHVNENTSPNDDARYVPTTPSLASQQMLIWEDPLAFYFCSIAVAPDRSIVYQTYSQLWRIIP
jgi:hypothetical protein